MAKKLDFGSNQGWLFDISQFSDADLTGSGSDLSNAVPADRFTHPGWRPNCELWNRFHGPTLQNLLKNYPPAKI